VPQTGFTSVCEKPATNGELHSSGLTLQVSVHLRWCQSCGEIYVSISLNVLFDFQYWNVSRREYYSSPKYKNCMLNIRVLDSWKSATAFLNPTRSVDVLPLVEVLRCADPPI
jgi:hypothetical protein